MNGRHGKAAELDRPTPELSELQDPGSLSMLAYLVGELANEPITDNADVVAELLAMEIVQHRLALLAR